MVNHFSLKFSVLRTTFSWPPSFFAGRFFSVSFAGSPFLRPLDAVDLGIHSWPVYLFTPRVSLFHGVSYHLCVNDTQIYISNLISLPEQQTQTIIYSMAKDILPKTAAPTHSSVIPI